MAPDRFDLITLNFLLFSERRPRADGNVSRERVKFFDEFIKSCNEILDKTCLGNIYVVNPYECFILMCILTDDPICTYSEVFEKSYES